MSRVLRLPVVTLVVGLLLVLAGLNREEDVAAQAGQATIIGSIVDANLSPLAGVAVALVRGERVQARTTSDTDGVFRFADVPVGTYQVKAERAGYTATVRDITVAASAGTYRLPLVLTTPADARNLDESKSAQMGASAQAPSVTRQALPAPAPAPLQQAENTAKSGDARTTVDGVFVSAVPSASPTAPAGRGGMAQGAVAVMRDSRSEPGFPGFVPTGELYAHVEPSRFTSAREHPLSTFGADVDTASYTNVRRFLQAGQLPPAEAVRIEEFINYFKFDYAAPRGGQPMTLTTEIGECPWAPGHKLVLVGARARTSSPRAIAGRNVVLLIDVSGSMGPADRLPLLKSALGMFVDTLRPDDRMSIVTYAGASGVALPPTPVRERDRIQRVIANLGAGGSTNGAQGIITAYRLARQQYIPGGVNRVILATDGDFNVGMTSQGDLQHLIERERESGVFLSVLGVGTGNLKDQTMEMLADKGNGHYSYLDSIQEARRVLVSEADSTLETVAKDVKFQVEFNPAVVSRWRLIGYDNRLLAARDFNDDRKDGGELGAGHRVTVLYEVVPVGSDRADDDDAPESRRPAVDPLRYQPSAGAVQSNARPAGAAGRAEAPRTGRMSADIADEWLTVKARFKAPEGSVSDLIERPVRVGGRVVHLPFAAAIAEFGLLLRDGAARDGAWDALVARVNRLSVPAAQVSDKDGFAELVAIARGLVRLER